MASPLPPLAARLRPQNLDQVVGQDHLLAPDAPFRRAVAAGSPPSVLLWGPPGTGKTTIARLMAEVAGMDFRQLSAVTSGMKDLRDLVEATRSPAGGLFDGRARRRLLLFVDEIHRWNKAQQDALLPHVEDGTVTLVGATTENPAFEVIGALRSRCWLLRLHPLSTESLEALLQRAARHPDGLAGRVDLTPEAAAIVARTAGGDARRALSILERAATLVPDGGTLARGALDQLAEDPDLLHDATGDAHYDVLSAFIKSLRGSDPDAALYWMARLLEAGEDPMTVARRMVIFAAEDIGNADPRSLGIAIDVMSGTHLVGMPEARILLAQACTWLACAPKSNAAYKAIDAALSTVRETGGLAVPIHLRNAPTALARELGHGAAYRYPHDYPDHIVRQDYLPPQLARARFYDPTPQGAEKTILERLAWWRTRIGD